MSRYATHSWPCGKGWSAETFRDGRVIRGRDNRPTTIAQAETRQEAERLSRARAFWVEDENFMPDMRHDPLPDVTERGPTDTGLVDQHGNTIMRLA